MEEKQKTKIKKQSMFSLVFTVLGVGGILAGVWIASGRLANENEFTSGTGKEEALVECLTSGKKECLEDVDLVDYQTVSWRTENENDSAEGIDKSCYNNDSALCEKYGGYYDFEDAQQICAKSDMRLPTHFEYVQLYKSFKTDADFFQSMNFDFGGVVLWDQISAWEGQALRLWTQNPFNPGGKVYFGLNDGETVVMAEMGKDLDGSRLNVRCVKDKFF